MTTNDVSIVESKANAPTQADRKLATDISFFCVNLEIAEGEIVAIFDHKKAMDMIAQHVQEAVQAALTQGMALACTNAINMGMSEADLSHANQELTREECKKYGVSDYDMKILEPMFKEIESLGKEVK